ncbi:MAG TPA: DoxX family protein, partial [Saprospiraceae bacterium]|nr:DoxX family protein [Saprospiraceae bacterium]
KNRVLFWASTGFIFLFEGMMPLITLLFATEYATAGTKPLGYPDYFAYALIVCKVLGATAIILPQLPDKIKEWAYAGLTFNMIFAVISHVVVDGFLFVSFFPLIILAILAVSYYYNSKLKANGTT